MVSSPPFSRLVLAFLCLTLGYVPYGIACYWSLADFFGMTRLWGGWNKELYLWGLMLLIFQALGIYLAITMIRVRPILAGFITFFGFIGFALYVINSPNSSFLPSLIISDDKLELLRFWSDGGGWVGALAVIPIVIWYLVVVKLEKKRQKGSGL